MIDKENSDYIARKKPPVFASGFQISKTNDGLVFIDFLDNRQHKKPKIFYSVAISNETLDELKSK